MPLTIRERTGSRRLLESLDTADLFSLAGTVTKKKSTACTRAEAINTILQNSLSASELLNRRKVLGDIIAAYLKNEGVPIPSKITKAEVVLKTLAHWSEPGSGIPGISSSLIQKPKANSPERVGWFDYDLYNSQAIGLSAQERVGCRKVLKSLDVLAISSLAGTIKDIDIILEKSKSAYELLNRKKVIRDAIAAYLKSEGVPISSNITKAEVVQKALVYWSELAIGLSAQERVGCRKVLKSLDVLAISSLAGTVSKKKSRACTSAEDIDIILEKSKSAYELLNRKKVIRDAIAAYLKSEGIPISSNITKAEVVQKALVYWSERAIGLSAQERVGCRKVLKSLDVLAISSLAGTVSKKKSRACTSAEDIDIILEKSKSAYELLNRKKVIREAIAAYLKSEGVPIASNITKAEVVQKALVYWSERDSCAPPSVMQRQKSSSSGFSYPFYYHTKSSIRSPPEDATKTKNLGAQTPDLHGCAPTQSALIRQYRRKQRDKPLSQVEWKHSQTFQKDVTEEQQKHMNIMNAPEL